MGYIYKITNNINNKVYIGQTCNTIEHRWKQHLESIYNTNYILYKAIRKYGIENFSIEKLEKCQDELLNEKEQYWIKYYNSYNNGYNMTLGGEGNRHYSDKEILELWNMGYQNYEIAKILKCSESTICERLKSILPFGEARKRHLEKNKKKVLQYSLYGVFIKEWNSMAEAEKELNLSSGSISRCCKKTRKRAGNYLWKNKNDNTSVEELVKNYALSSDCKDVYLVDDENNFIEYFQSARDAEKKYNIAKGKVSEICWHKYGRKTGNGLKFEWAFPKKREIAYERNERT